MSKKLVSFFLLSLLIVALSGCQSQTEPEISTVPEGGAETSTVEETESESTEETLPAESSEVGETSSSESTEPEETAPAATSVNVVGTDFSFAPSSLTFTSGQTVTLTFQNNGGAPHNLVVEGTDIKTATIGGGESTTLTFTAPATGTYTFYCGVGGHRDAGMVGTLVTQ